MALRASGPFEPRLEDEVALRFAREQSPQALRQAERDVGTPDDCVYPFWDRPWAVSPGRCYEAALMEYALGHPLERVKARFLQAVIMHALRVEGGGWESESSVRMRAFTAIHERPTFKGFETAAFFQATFSALILNQIGWARAFGRYARGRERVFPTVDQRASAPAAEILRDYLVGELDLAGRPLDELREGKRFNEYHYIGFMVAGIARSERETVERTVAEFVGWCDRRRKRRVPNSPPGYRHGIDPNLYFCVPGVALCNLAHDAGVDVFVDHVLMPRELLAYVPEAR